MPNRPMVKAPDASYAGVDPPDDEGGERDDDEQVGVEGDGHLRNGLDRA